MKTDYNEFLDSCREGDEKTFAGTWLRDVPCPFCGHEEIGVEEVKPNLFERFCYKCGRSFGAEIGRLT